VNELDIARIRAYAVTPPLMAATRFIGRGQPVKMNIEIVRLTLGNGVEGIASSDSGWGATSGGDIVRDIRELSPRVIGRNVLHRETLTESLLADAGEGPWDAISIIDCAMWDAYARSVGRPLWQIFGGHQQRIDAYASTQAHRTIEEYLYDVERFAALGYRAIKFHMNTDPDFDLEMVQAVARAHRDTKLRFMVDLEQCYTFDEAVRLGETLDKLPFDWMEAPLPDHDLDAFVELNKAVAIDILPAGNTLVGLKNWSNGLRRKAWSRLRCDPTNAGGVTTVIKAMELARARNVPVELQSYGFQLAQNINLHLMLGLGGCTWFEHPAPQEPYDYATRKPLMLDAKGCVGAVEGSGLGIDIDWELIVKDAFATFDTKERADE
jgi:L-alanine-DL-glutamate epimerase-like enolase superfamily enzyme